MNFYEPYRTTKRISVSNFQRNKVGKTERERKEETIAIRREIREDGNCFEAIHRFHGPCRLSSNVTRCLVDTTARSLAQPAAGTRDFPEKSNSHRLTAFISPSATFVAFSLFLFLSFPRFLRSSSGTPHFSPIEPSTATIVALPPTSKRGRLIIGLSAFLTLHPRPHLFVKHRHPLIPRHG